MNFYVQDGKNPVESHGPWPRWRRNLRGLSQISENLGASAFKRDLSIGPLPAKFDSPTELARTTGPRMTESRKTQPRMD
jgi:hypothetical protein